MKILLIGKNGQLGSELYKLLSERYDVLALGRDEIDLNEPDSLSQTLRVIPAVSLLVNAAAYTNVDGAETNQTTASNVNAFAPEILAAETKRRGIPIVHFSTDYIFDGIDRNIAYTEEDKPNPLSVYGWTKLGGEVAIRETNEKHLIFRTSGVYGGERNFVRTILASLASGISPKVVCDQTVSPNWSRELAENIVNVIGRFLSGDSIPWGMYHLSGGGETTWYDFATHLCSHALGRYDSIPLYPISVTSDEFGAFAARPAYSVLDGTKLRETFGIVLPEWDVQFGTFWQQRINP